MIQTNAGRLDELMRAAESRWPGEVRGRLDGSGRMVQLAVCAERLRDVSGWLFADCSYRLATLVVVEGADQWTLHYIFLGEAGGGRVDVVLQQPLSETVVPSISGEVHAADWHERETEDLFGLQFQGHPRLGDFVLHEDWPEGVNPMRRAFDAWRPYAHREVNPQWRPVTVVQAPGSFLMPIGPVYSDYAESAQFFLETVGEDVIRTIPRLFFKYRGVEKIVEGRLVAEALLLAERFSGTSAFAHSLAFCSAVEQIAGVEPPRARGLRVVLADALDKLQSELGELNRMLRFSSSFLDRLEEVGMVTPEKAVTYGLVGPVARASGVAWDLRRAHPYGGYDERLAFAVPVEQEGDGYARLRVLFDEAQQSAGIVQQVAGRLPSGPVCPASIRRAETATC